MQISRLKTMVLKIIGQNVAKYRKKKRLITKSIFPQMGYKSVSVVSGAEIYYNGKQFNLRTSFKNISNSKY